MKLIPSLVLLCAAGALTPAFAQTKPAETKAAEAKPADTKAAAPKMADNMQAVREKIKADKKLVVATNMELTEAEAKAFWPVYEDYQKELSKVNEQLGKTIAEYAAEYNAKTLTNEKAAKLLDQTLAVEEAETKLKRSFVPKLNKVLPAQKVARYMQIENKIRSIVKYELAAEVPLIP